MSVIVLLVFSHWRLPFLPHCSSSMLGFLTHPSTCFLIGWEMKKKRFSSLFESIAVTGKNTNFWTFTPWTINEFRVNRFFRHVCRDKRSSAHWSCHRVRLRRTCGITDTGIVCTYGVTDSLIAQNHNDHHVSLNRCNKELFSSFRVTPPPRFCDPQGFRKGRSF